MPRVAEVVDVFDRYFYGRELCCWRCFGHRARRFLGLPIFMDFAMDRAKSRTLNAIILSLFVWQFVFTVFDSYFTRAARVLWQPPPAPIDPNTAFGAGAGAALHSLGVFAAANFTAPPPPPTPAPTSFSIELDTEEIESMAARLTMGVALAPSVIANHPAQHWSASLLALAGLAIVGYYWLRPDAQLDGIEFYTFVAFLVSAIVLTLHTIIEDLLGGSTFAYFTPMACHRRYVKSVFARARTDPRYAHIRRVRRFVAANSATLASSAAGPELSAAAGVVAADTTTATTSATAAAAATAAATATAATLSSADDVDADDNDAQEHVAIMRAYALATDAVGGDAGEDGEVDDDDGGDVDVADGDDDDAASDGVPIYTFSVSERLQLAATVGSMWLRKAPGRIKSTVLNSFITDINFIYPNRLVAACFLSLYFIALSCYAASNAIGHILGSGLIYHGINFTLGPYWARAAFQILTPCRWLLPLGIGAVLLLNLLMTFRNYRRMLLRVRRGQYPYSRVRLSTSTWLLGYQLAHTLGCALLVTIVYVILGAIGIAFYLSEPLRQMALDYFLKSGILLVNAKILKAVLDFCVFTQARGRLLNNFRCYSMYDTFELLVSAVAGPIVMIIRFALMFVVTLFSFSRLDLPIVRSPFVPYIDTVFNSFYGMLLTDHQYCNPIFRVFLEDVLGAVDADAMRFGIARRRRLQQRSQRWSAAVADDASGRRRLLDDYAAIDDGTGADGRDDHAAAATAAACRRRKRNRIVNRWRLWAMLLLNPSLIPLRKHHLVERRSRFQRALAWTRAKATKSVAVV